MPVRVGTKDHWELIEPTTNWQTLKTTLKKAEFEVATDLYYVDVEKRLESEPERSRLGLSNIKAQGKLRTASKLSLQKR